MPDKKILLGRNIKYFLLGNENLTGRSNSISVANTAEVKDAPTFESDALEREPGLLDGALSFGGYTQDAALFDRVAATAAAKAAFNVGLKLGAAGDPVLLGKVQAFQHELAAPEGELETFKLEVKPDDVLVLGKMLHNAWDTPVVATGNGAAVNLGATVTSPQRLHAVLSVRDIVGAGGTVTFVIESDDADGFPSPVTRVTFAVEGEASPNPVGQCLRIDAPITPDTRYRAKWTLGGGATSARFAVAAGIR